MTLTANDAFSLSDQGQPYNTPIQPYELDPVLAHLKDTTVGQDTIPNWFFRNASSSLKKTMFKVLFNQSFLQGKFPDALKVANLVAIPQPKKTSRFRYRSIS